MRSKELHYIDHPIVGILVMAMPAKEKKKPNEIAEEIAKALPSSDLIEKIETKGPYINFYVNKSELIKETISQITSEETFGKKENNKKTIFIDYSAPEHCLTMPWGV